MQVSYLHGLNRSMNKFTVSHINEMNAGWREAGPLREVEESGFMRILLMGIKQLECDDFVTQTRRTHSHPQSIRAWFCYEVSIPMMLCCSLWTVVKCFTFASQ